MSEYNAVLSLLIVAFSMVRNVSHVCFCFYRLVHQGLLQSPCKAEFEDGVHLRNKFKTLQKLEPVDLIIGERCIVWF